MAYTKTDWKNKVVEKPRRFTWQDNGDGTITLIPAEGTIYEAGTPVNAVNLNKIEQGIADAQDAAKLLALIKTVDGSGSALEADLLDGKHGNEYISKIAYLGSGFDFNTVVDSGVYRMDAPGSNGPPIGVAYGQLLVMHGGGDTITQIATSYGNSIIFMRSGNPSNVGGNGTWGSWYQIMTSAQSIPTRLNNGLLEYDSGGGVWKKVGGYGSTRYKGSFSTASTSNQTVLSLTGMGSLRSLSLTPVHDDGNSIWVSPIAEITVDGVIYIPSAAASTVTGWMQVDGSVSTTFAGCDIKFENSLVVKMKSSSPNPAGFQISCSYTYELV